MPTAYKFDKTHFFKAGARLARFCSYNRPRVAAWCQINELSARRTAWVKDGFEAEMAAIRAFGSWGRHGRRLGMP